MYARYGTHTHDAEEVGVSTSITTQFSERGLPLKKIRRVNLTGKLITQTQSEMNSAIHSLLSAYSVHGKDFVLYMDDGTPTHHSLYNANSLGGVRVVAGPDFTEPEEVFAVVRTYSIALEAHYDLHPGSAIVSYQENVSVQGTGGPQIAVVPLLTGPPDVQVVRTHTPVYITQRGSAVGRSRWPAPNAPLLPQLLLEPDQNIERQLPEMENGVYKNWPVTWAYRFVSSGYTSASPRSRS